MLPLLVLLDFINLVIILFTFSSNNEESILLKDSSIVLGSSINFNNSCFIFNGPNEEKDILSFMYEDIYLLSLR